MKLWEHNLTKEEIEWINKKEIKSAKVYGNIKTYKENNLYGFTVSGKGTTIVILAHWIEYLLKQLSSEPFDKEKLWFISRDIANYYPNCETKTFLEAVGQLLDFCSQNIPEKQHILDAFGITVTGNKCNFMGRHFMKIDDTTIGEPESANITDIMEQYLLIRKLRRI